MLPMPQKGEIWMLCNELVTILDSKLGDWSAVSQISYMRSDNQFQRRNAVWWRYYAKNGHAYLVASNNGKIQNEKG